MPPNGIDPSLLARVASAVSVEQEQGGQEKRSALARVAVFARMQKRKRTFSKISSELGHWRDEAEANERKRATCFMLVIFALGDDIIDAISALVSVGILGSFTFPVPGMLRMIVAAQERTPKPDRLLRAILAMIIEAIPMINVLPTTTINLLVDLTEAHFDAEYAKSKVEQLTKEINALVGSMKVDRRILRQITRIA